MRIDIQFSLPGDTHPALQNSLADEVAEFLLKNGAISLEVGFDAKGPLDGRRYNGGVGGYGAAVQPKSSAASEVNPPGS